MASITRIEKDSGLCKPMYLKINFAKMIGRKESAAVTVSIKIEYL